MKFGMRLLHFIFLSMFVTTVTAEIFTPINVDASDGTFTDKVRIVWDVVPNAETFRVFRCDTTGNTCGSPIGLPKDPIFNDMGGVGGTTYWYRVKACNPTDGCSGFSTANSGFRATTIEDEVGFLKQQVADLMTLLEGATRMNTDGYDTLQFSGMNVQIVNGDDVTGSMNGTGNLIVGYNESRNQPENDICLEPTNQNPLCDHRDGSHNVIIGDQHNYISWGGLVAGIKNDILDQYASVSGGTGNRASGILSSISGGGGNRASGTLSSISGGGLHIASGSLSSISGGEENLASGTSSSISGGISNITSGDNASISGGTENVADGQAASISGGINNLASGPESSISGGSGNLASGITSSISGGLSNIAEGQESSISGGLSNHAEGQESSISGGFSNHASGITSSISGGRFNTAEGQESSISGGGGNRARGRRSSVSGGTDNKSNGGAASISGGDFNVADGEESSISGGLRNRATGRASSISGGLEKEASTLRCVVGDNGDDC